MLLSEFAPGSISFVNKVIGTRGQGVRVWCPRELTTEHLIEASLQLDWPLSGSFGLEPLSSFGRVEICLKFHETWTLIVVIKESLLRLNLHKMRKF